MSERAPRVMQSFKPPRPTTNPYITMLDQALNAEPSLVHLRFSWRAALLSRVDVFHMHWPEVILEGNTAWKRLVKRSLMRLVLLKLRATNAAVVRTMHNIDLPQDISAPTRRLLTALDRRTDHRILLNSSTVVRKPEQATVIPHGHYRDWFEKYPRGEQIARRIGYFGLIRRYKGVEALLDAYEKAHAADPSLSLRIGGKPSSPDLAAAVESVARRVTGISATLRFLEDAEIVDLASSSQLIVLPYRVMHNSGGTLAALSIDRPVLVPRNDVNEALSEEVGPGWVHLYEADLTPDRLLAVVDETASVTGRPDLSRRDWSGVGPAHMAVYQAALTTRGRG